MATYNQTVSQGAAGSNSEAGVDSRLTKTISQSSTGASTQTNSNVGKPIKDSAKGSHYYRTTNTMARVLQDQGFGSDVPVPAINKWDDPRNNIVIDTLVTSGSFVFVKGNLSDIDQSGQGMDFVTVTVNGVTIINNILLL